MAQSVFSGQLLCFWAVKIWFGHYELTEWAVKIRLKISILINLY